jgi:hypothetical protein
LKLVAIFLSWASDPDRRSTVLARDLDPTPGSSGHDRGERITSVFSMADFVLVALAFMALQRLRITPVWVVMVLAGLGVAGF